MFEFTAATCTRKRPHDSEEQESGISPELEFEMKGEEGKAGDYLKFILVCTLLLHVRLVDTRWLSLKAVV